MSATYMRRCAGKDRHETQAEAVGHRGALKAAKNFKRAKVDVYRCDQCLGWHVGRGNKSFSTRERQRGRRGAKRPNRRMRGRV